MSYRRSWDMPDVVYVGDEPVTQCPSGGYYATGVWHATARLAIKAASQRYRYRLRLRQGL